ncbi:Transmembrane channel-like protein 3 [Blomia tropicalis]|nr:Transmembrane channel-like protein 3 [Blomia tropicalis]
MSDNSEMQDPVNEEKTLKRSDSDVIRLSTSRGRRGSSSFLTSDDQVVISIMSNTGRRLSSICTASSYDQDTQVSFNEDATEEEISETIRQHKNIISNMKEQHIQMSRKLKVLNRSKNFLKRHEGELKQSKQAKDLFAKYNVYMERTINRFKRELANLIVVITPWEMRIKKIESHFGSGILRGDPDPTGMRKEVENKDESLKLQVIWEFEGYLKYSPIFYGYYSKTEMTSEGYRLPLAYFLTSFCLYMFSFFCVLQKMAQNARMSRIGSKDDESTFCWKIFTGWDYMIGNGETAYNKVASLVMGLKESILEEKERKKEKQSWKLQRSLEPVENPSWFRSNEVTFVVAGIGIVYPNIFDFIGSIENNHPRITLRWQLGRILILNFLNMYTLMLSLFGKVDSMTSELQQIRGNITLNRQQFDMVAVSTLATFRAKRDGRDEYPDYEMDYETTLYPPAIIYDPYEVAKIDIQMEGRAIDSTDDIESTTITTSWLSTTQTYMTNTKSERIDWNKSTTMIISNHTTSSVLISEASRLSTQSIGTSTTRERPKKMPTRRPSTRYRAGQFTTTTEMVTESTFMLQTAPSCLNVTEYKITDEDLMALNETDKNRLRKLCWETMFGQELVKLTVMDFIMVVISTLTGDFIRAIIVRYCNGCTCFFWDLEKKWPGYSDFKIAENILHLVNNQGMIWLGMFFSPGLPAINTIKLCLLMYVRSWAVLTCNIPHETVFKASRNNNFYFILLLLMLFLCTLPVSYAVVWLEPSWHCGPFSDYSRIYKILSNYIESKLNNMLNKVLDYLTSPGAVLPLLLLLILFIYYLISTVSSLKDANKELKAQLRKDKDASEATNLAGLTVDGPAAPNLGKHVRIQENEPKNDKSHLLESCDTSVLSA